MTENPIDMIISKIISNIHIYARLSILYDHGDVGSRLSSWSGWMLVIDPDCIINQVNRSMDQLELFPLAVVIELDCDHAY